MAQQKKAVAGSRKAAAPKTAARTATKSVPAEGTPLIVDAFAAPLKAINKAVKDAVELTAVEAVMAPATRILGAGADRAREAYAQAKATSEHVHQALAETAAVNTRGALDVNGKVLDAWRAQSEIALDLWRQSLAAGSVADAVRLQASGARQAYETAANHWKDLAEATGRWFGESVKPMRALGQQSR